MMVVVLLLVVGAMVLRASEYCTGSKLFLTVWYVYDGFGAIKLFANKVQFLFIFYLFYSSSLIFVSYLANWNTQETVARMREGWGYK